MKSKKTKINLIIISGLLLGCSEVTAVNSAGTNIDNKAVISPVIDEKALVKEGREVYNAICVRCHGPNMVNPGTISYDLRKFPADQKDRFIDSVSNGKRRMPPWKHILSSEEIQSVWVYVLTKGEL